MMNASVNGMSMYDYNWNNGMSGVNQTSIYSGWCVTITDLITGCDTTICENCIPDTMAFCPCPMIYIAVCGCDGVMYSNSCQQIVVLDGLLFLMVGRRMATMYYKSNNLLC